MSCEHLICAQCAGPVVEGRCATCRAGRAQVHGSFALPPQLVAVLLVALVLLAAAAAHAIR